MLGTLEVISYSTESPMLAVLASTLLSPSTIFLSMDGASTLGVTVAAGFAVVREQAAVTS